MLTDGQVLGLIVFGLFALAAGLIYLGMREERKQRRLPNPQSDPRDYSGAFMRDFKRSTPRRI